MARLLTVLGEREKTAIDLDKKYMKKQFADQIKSMEALNNSKIEQTK
jgi:hypothetical protein